MTEYDRWFTADKPYQVRAWWRPGAAVQWQLWRALPQQGA
jgi:hypothetical protein